MITGIREIKINISLLPIFTSLLKNHQMTQPQKNEKDPGFIFDGQEDHHISINMRLH